MPELVLLDIMLPDEDGLSILRKTAWNCSNSEASGDDADSEGNRI